jgi:hypothetical protein
MTPPRTVHERQMNTWQPPTELAAACPGAHAVQNSSPDLARAQIRVETSLLAGRRSGEINHPPGEVDGVVAKTLVEARHQRHLHRHRQCHAS